MVGASAAPLMSSMNPAGNFERMDDALEEALETSPFDATLSVVYQLNSEVTSEDRKWLEDHGAELLGEAPLVDGGLLEASATNVRVISEWSRTEYLELNRELDFSTFHQNGEGNLSPAS